MATIEERLAELRADMREGFASIRSRLDERFGESGTCAHHASEIKKLWASVHGVSNWIRGLAVSLALVALAALFASLRR